MDIDYGDIAGSSLTLIGTYVNVGNPNGLPDISVPTSVFEIQSMKTPKIVPVNPNKGN